jgi:hypothetical protein
VSREDFFAHTRVCVCVMCVRVCDVCACVCACTCVYALLLQLAGCHCVRNMELFARHGRLHRPVHLPATACSTFAWESLIVRLDGVAGHGERRVCTVVGWALHDGPVLHLHQ